MIGGGGECNNGRAVGVARQRERANRNKDGTDGESGRSGENYKESRRSTAEDSPEGGGASHAEASGGVPHRRRRAPVRRSGMGAESGP